MARNDKVDPKQALRAAVDAFWDSGFARTSMDDLTTKMKMGRSTIQQNFGDKRALYLQALDEYRVMTQAQAKALFDSGATARECFSTILFGISDASLADLERGCMMVNANIERAKGDRDLAKLIKRNAAEVRELFSTVLQSAQGKGEMPANKDPNALASFLFATVHGMRHIGRATADRATLRQIATVALASLE
jgi:TetR/AcrR family transcriptional regulator, transcriptional repressor for nem operon